MKILDLPDNPGDVFDPFKHFIHKSWTVYQELTEGSSAMRKAVGKFHSNHVKYAFNAIKEIRNEDA